MSEWRPIATAPLDGTVVDVYFSIDNAGDRMLYGSGRMTEWSYEDGQWASASGGLSRLVTASEKIPTHWMPVPEPPNDAHKPDGE